MMTNYKAKPDEALKEFQVFSDKIACCVSLDDIEKKAPVLKVKKEFMNYNSSLLTTCLNKITNKLLEGLELENKLQHLNELDKENKENAIAWRPETGKPDISSIEGTHLSKEVKHLKKNINHLRKQSSLLQGEISEFRNQISMQEEQMKKKFPSQNI